MPVSNGHDIAPDRAMSINEACAATGLSARKINQLIDEEVLPDSVCLKHGSARALLAHSMPMAVLYACD